MKNNNYNKRRAYLKMLFWVIFILVTANIIAYLFQGPRLFSSFSHYLTYTSLGYAYGFFFAFGNSFIGSYTQKLNWAKNPKRANLTSFLMFIGYGIFVSVMIPYTFDRLVWDMTGKSLFYDVTAKAFITMVADLIVIYFYFSNRLTDQWVKAIEKNEELKRENLLARYEALKNQVNPHFLFNSLNTLTGVVEQKPEQAPAFIKKLSDIYRYVLDQNDKELVAIHEELNFVNDYVFLSKMRLGNGLIFYSHIPTGQNYQVVPLGIQMLVENAIKHNIASDDMPLKIEIKIENSLVIVRNNLQRKKTVSAGKKPLGLENLKKRYAYLSAKPVEIIETDKEFIVKFPVIELKP